MSIAHIISEICNLRIRKIILIGYSTTLLDYKHQFMGSLHALDSKLVTPSFVSLLFTSNTRLQLILFSGMLNQLQNWILKELVLLWVLVVPTLSSYTMMTWFMRIELALGSFLCIRTYW